jgi:hypothetical protein
MKGVATEQAAGQSPATDWIKLMCMCTCVSLLTASYGLKKPQDFVLPLVTNSYVRCC